MKASAENECEMAARGITPSPSTNGTNGPLPNPGKSNQSYEKPQPPLEKGVVGRPTLNKPSTERPADPEKGNMNKNLNNDEPDNENPESKKLKEDRPLDTERVLADMDAMISSKARTFEDMSKKEYFEGCTRAEQNLKIAQNGISDLDQTIIVERADFAKIFVASQRAYTRRAFTFEDSRSYYVFISCTTMLLYFKRIAGLKSFTNFIDQQIPLQSKLGIHKYWYNALKDDILSLEPIAVVDLIYHAGVTLWAGQPYRLKPDDLKRGSNGNKWGWAIPVRIHFKEEGRNLKRVLTHMSELLQEWYKVDHQNYIKERVILICKPFDCSEVSIREAAFNAAKSEGLQNQNPGKRPGWQQKPNTTSVVEKGTKTARKGKDTNGDDRPVPKGKTSHDPQDLGETTEQTPKGIRQKGKGKGKHGKWGGKAGSKNVDSVVTPRTWPEDNPAPKRPLSENWPAETQNTGFPMVPQQNTMHTNIQMDTTITQPRDTGIRQDTLTPNIRDTPTPTHFTFAPRPKMGEATHTHANNQDIGNNTGTQQPPMMAHHGNQPRQRVNEIPVVFATPVNPAANLIHMDSTRMAAPQPPRTNGNQPTGQTLQPQTGQVYYQQSERDNNQPSNTTQHTPLMATVVEGQTNRREQHRSRYRSRSQKRTRRSRTRRREGDRDTKQSNRDKLDRISKNKMEQYERYNRQR